MLQGPRSLLAPCAVAVGDLDHVGLHQRKEQLSVGRRPLLRQGVRDHVARIDPERLGACAPE
eukprot:4192367-Alexandrium_andersonii.AAC.1